MDDVLIVGSLKDDELRSSIDSLVTYVGKKTDEMATDFNHGLDLMKLAMKDFAITQKVSVDLMKQAWREMSSSFDAMVAAQSGATGGGHGSGKPTYPDNTIGQLKETIALEEKKRDSMQRGTQELQAQNDLLAKQKNALKEETTSLANKRLNNALKMDNSSLDDAQKKLRLLEILQKRYNDTTELSVSEQNKLARAIAQTKKQIDKLTEKKPKTLDEVIGIKASSIDEITAKMRALKRVQVDPQNTLEVKKLGDEYARLQRELAKLMGKNIQLTHSNNYLAQSFGYIRNRIVYALTLGAITSFTKQIYEIRGQYELLERSLGILINDMRKGSEMFNELNQMAIKSPFTLMELATGAKQLLAYNFAEEEVVDTTRRLADISAALGVPMERLVYNLGQIKAQTALTARDARDFANAGLAIVPMLAQMYTEEKRFGDEMVTTAQVFDMMSKKMVSYADVIKVINKVTDEGGKFYDFQAKQADTLRVKMANLTLAWNNMLNEMGSENQKALTLPVTALKAVYENWRTLLRVITEVIVAYGSYRAALIVTNALQSRMFIGRILVSWRNYTAAINAATGAMATFNAVTKISPIGALAAVLAAAIGYIAMFKNEMNDAGGYTEKFGEAGAKVINETEALFDTLKGISKESSNYKKVLNELNSILEEHGIETINETDSMDVLNEKRRVAIALIKEETLERKHLNDVQQGRDEFENTANEAKKKFKESLKNSMTGSAFWMSGDSELKKNSEAIANIIGDVVENNISLIANKTGDEYEKGVEQIFGKIREKMRAIGIDESTIESEWIERRWYGQVNIVSEYIEKIKDAKEAQDQYTDAIDNAYESEEKAIRQGANFNDRVEQTQTQLMKAANDTENFYKKIDKLIKDYSGLNIVEFLVKVKTEVPAWMSQKGLTELTQLSARFSALATNAQKAGKESVDFGNGKIYTVQQLFERAAQYAQAAQNKRADLEARKSTTLTRDASDALKEYKTALEAVNVAKNKMKQGTADQTLVTEKETEAQKAWNKALEKGVSIKELQEAKNGKKGGGSKKDELGDALTKEIQLITDMQKLYKEYKKAGVDADAARIASAKEYEKTLQSTNAKLQKYGIRGLSGESLATMDARDLREYYTKMREIAEMKGNTKGVEALEKAIRSLNNEITKVDYKKIVDGLNNELAKVKGEYELAVELDANPELGSMFANMMGISMNELKELPKDFEGVVNKMQSIVDGKLGKGVFDVRRNLNKKAFDEYLSGAKLQVDSDKAKALKAVVDFANDVQKKETTKQIEEWKKLLEKYSEYEYKRNQIAETAARERETATKKGASADVLNAIDKKQKQETAKLDFEYFQKTPEWIAATGDLATLSHKAIAMLIDDLEEYRLKAKHLDPKQIKEINRALSNLYKEQRKNNPFKAISNLLEQSRENFKNYQAEIDEVEEEMNELYKMQGKSEWSDAQSKKLDDLFKRWKKLKDLQESGLDATDIVSSMNETVSAVRSAVGVFDDLAKAIGGVNNSDVDKVFSVLEKAGQGAATGAQFGGWGAIIGGAVGMATGLITTFADEWSGNAGITSAIEESNRAVKKLENSLKRLEDAANDAYGVAEIGAKRAVIANKELQLIELKRQLQLEESRKSKNKDQDRIETIKGQIIDLEIELKDALKDITNDMLGISGVGAAAEQMIASMIESFRQGEDYMSVFSNSFDEMVDNMIKKAIVSKVIGEKLNEVFKKVEEQAQARAESMVLTHNDVYATPDWIDNYTMTAKEWLDKLKKEYASDYYTEEGREMVKRQIDRVTKIMEQAYEITPEDVNSVRTEVNGFKDEVKEKFDAYMDLFGVVFGQDTTKQLSALQQGISGITEDTAGALEAYMNVVSQKVFEQNEYLMQILDIITGFDLDVQVATMGQILLQLQASYQVQQAIQMRLDGWSNANGMAVRVEMI